MRRLALALACTFAAVAISAAPSTAIINGNLDGELHPNVGVLISDIPNYGDFVPYCTGTLISPTVVLTAAHCAPYPDEEFLGVSFDSVLTTDSTVHSGTFYAYEGFNQAQKNSGDIAVVVLDEPVVGITPAELPTLGLLDQLKKDGLLTQATQFTSVGYGITYTIPGARPPFLDDQTRRYAVGTYSALSPGYLRIGQVAARGEGGTCLGDSGGPTFLGAGADETNLLVSITSVGDSACKATNVTYRLDTAAAEEFLGRFVTLP